MPKVLLAAFAALMLLPAASAPAAGLTGVDLSTYTRVGRYDLPEPTRTTPPANSLLAQEASGVAYDSHTDTLFVVGDGGTSVVQVDKTGHLIDSMTLATGSSSQGTEFYDTEGITYLGEDGSNRPQLVFTEERNRQLVRFSYVPNTTLTRAATDTVKLGTTIGNVGLEGVSNDPAPNGSGGLLVVKEKTPESIFQTTVNWAAGTATNGSPTADAATDLFPPANAGLSDFSDVFALSNLSTLTGTDTSHLLIISQESGKIENLSRTGTVSSTLTIRGDADNPLSVPDQTMEGVTMDNAGRLYLVNEQGGGDFNHPQVWVYAPSTTPNQAPTGVALTHQTTSLPENTSTAARLKVADVDVQDSADGNIGTNDLAITGPDASSFEVDSTGLYVKAGVTLDYETKSSYTVSVTAHDATVSGSATVTSTPYTLTLTDVAVETPPSGSLIISEVAPWGSSTVAPPTGNGYAADWFELTNTGSDAISLSGYKMDDDSESFATAVSLTGVPSLGPGQSAIFLEAPASGTPSAATIIANFKTTWFGASPPAGLQVGSYSGSGVGLSTSSDAVSIFDGTGHLVTAVRFGASTTGKSFDNAAGAGGTTTPATSLPALTTLSSDGTKGAFVSAADAETGSPGTSPTVVVSEVAPWGSGATTGYQADWFEVTNVSGQTVSLNGWRMDDSSAALATAVALNGVATLAPGESAIFLEVATGTTAAAVVSAFKALWFPVAAPSGLQIGTYGGAGVGLSTSSDGVVLFNHDGDRVTGVSFGSTAAANTSLENVTAQAGSALGTPPTIAGLSAAGTRGAYARSGQTGSPGATANDTTPPVIAYSGNAGTYTTAQQLNIACRVTDAAGGSGVSSSTCADLTGSGASYGLGSHTITADATDNAGNAATPVSVTFTITQAPYIPPSGSTTTPTSTTTTPADTTPPASGPATAPPAFTAPSIAPPRAPRLILPPASALSGTFIRGVAFTFDHLKPGSVITVKVRLGDRTLETQTAHAGRDGTGLPRVKLTREQRHGLVGQTLTITFTVIGADGTKKTVTTKLKVR